METIVERPAALDVHKAQVTACVRVPADGGGRERARGGVRDDGRGAARRLRDWLAAHGVTQVAMEATGVYWKPVWAILEDELRAACWSTRATSSRSRAARPTSRTRQWLCQLAEAGLLKASFVPPKPIRALRNLTRYRKTQIQERQREANRLHKALEDTGIKLDCVATDILGKSGPRDARRAGGRAPPTRDVLAELARGQLRKKLPALREALEGRFDAAARAVDRGDPRPHRLPRRADRPALGRDRGADRPFRARRLSCCARSPASSAAPPR